MRRLLFAFALGGLLAGGAVAEKLPTLYYDLGTPRDDVLFEMGEPKIRLPDGGLLYEAYSGVNTLETIRFYFDEDYHLVGYTINIGLDYQHAALPMEEFQNRVYRYYRDLFQSLYGEPYVSNQIGMVWRFDDGFVVFQPFTRDTFLRFYFMCMPKELAAGLGYGMLYGE